MRTLSIFLIGITSFFPAIVQPNGATVIPSSPPIISKETVFSFYKSFKKLEPSPIDIKRFVWETCVSLGKLEEDKEQVRAGPHIDTVFNLYVNALAENTVTQKSPTFPTSAIVVLEELESRAHSLQLWDREEEPIAGPNRPQIYGMIKRTPGFDPQNGNWEYFYAGTLEFAETGGFAKGRLEGCIACHAKAKDADYVFKVRNPEKALHNGAFQIWDREETSPSETLPAKK